MNKAFRQHNFLKKIKAEFANWKLNDFSSFSMATLVLWVVYNENAMRMCCRHWNMKWAKLNASYLTVVDSFTYRWNNIHGGWVTTSSYLSLKLHQQLNYLLKIKAFSFKLLLGLNGSSKSAEQLHARIRASAQRRGLFLRSRLPIVNHSPIYGRYNDCQSRRPKGSTICS